MRAAQPSSDEEMFYVVVEGSQQIGEFGMVWSIARAERSNRFQPVENDGVSAVAGLRGARVVGRRRGGCRP